ncbi:MAG: hypothetical protein WD118_01110 [Phycisphaeraceae bacterium]
MCSLVRLTLLLMVFSVGLSGCYRFASSEGGGQAAFSPPRTIAPADVALPAGYRIEAIAVDLTYPTAVTVDDRGQVYVVEGGYSYGEAWAEPRLLRIEPDGATTVIVAGDNPPWTGVVFHDGAFYLSEGGLLEGGRIVHLTMDGQVTPLVENIPTHGDHHTNAPAVGPDGKIYFGAGTTTNSGVVGIDNIRFGWVERFPDFHDVPARDIALAGRNHETTNPLTADPDDTAVTGAFLPFGTPSAPGQRIAGRLPANGAIMRVAAAGGKMELVAWGLRNPYGLAFSPDGQLFATENQFDVRGSRPIWGTGDLLWQIDWRQPGRWHGWPDFFAGQPLAEGDRFQAPGEPAPQFLLADHPETPPTPVTRFAVHASANGLDFPPNNAFGFEGHAFVAQFGDLAPAVGKVLAPVGYNVVTVDPASGVIVPFAANAGPTNGPASQLGGGGLERPVDVAFSPDGTALYIADFGVMTTSDQGPQPRAGTGVVWRVTREPGR